MFSGECCSKCKINLVIRVKWNIKNITDGKFGRVLYIVGDGRVVRWCWVNSSAGVGWLFWVERPFETIFQSISGRLKEREREEKR